MSSANLHDKLDMSIKNVGKVNRLGYVDSLRAIAAIYVVMHHNMLEIWAPDYGIYPSGSLSSIANAFRYGHYSVSLFIIISGFCLMLPVLKNEGELRGGIKTFFIRRAKRILPPYYFSLIISLILIYFFIGSKTHTHWDCSLPVTLHTFITHLFLVHDIFPGGGGLINHVYWSIAVEWHIYFLFPLMLILWRRIGPWLSTIGILLFGFIFEHFLHHTPYGGITAQFFGLFALGMLAVTIAYGQETKYQKIRRAPWAIITLLMSVVLWRAFRHWGIESLFDELFMGLFGFSLLIAASVESSIIRKILNWRPLIVIGTFSYSIYLIHAPIIQIIWQYAIHPFHYSRTMEFVILEIVGTPIMIGIAYIFYLCFEKPFMNKPIVK